MDSNLDKFVHIAVFISDHGFGHGTRTCAVLSEILKLVDCEITIFSRLPEWFFKQNLGQTTRFNHYECKVDVGLTQKGPFIHDLGETVKSLNNFLEFNGSEYVKIEKILNEVSYDAIISDISPLGIHFANKINIPSILVENFTWDWIYEGYRNDNPSITSIIATMTKIYKEVDLRIQATPFCEPIKTGISVPPISRSLREKPDAVRKRLGIPLSSTLVLMTTGGISNETCDTKKLDAYKNFIFIRSSNGHRLNHKNNIISLPLGFDVHYPDLVNASDLVVGKVGYGTLAECWFTKTPLLGCFREGFRESCMLKKYAKKNLYFHDLTVDDFEDMNWINRAVDISTNNEDIKSKSRISGANQAAKSITEFIVK